MLPGDPLWHPAGFSTWPQASLFAQDSKAGIADRVQWLPINSIKGRDDDKRDIRTQKHGSATRHSLYQARSASWVAVTLFHSVFTKTYFTPNDTEA